MTTQIKSLFKVFAFTSSLQLSFFGRNLHFTQAGIVLFWNFYSNSNINRMFILIIKNNKILTSLSMKIIATATIKLVARKKIRQQISTLSRLSLFALWALLFLHHGFILRPWAIAEVTQIMMTQIIKIFTLFVFFLFLRLLSFWMSLHFTQAGIVLAE